MYLYRKLLSEEICKPGKQKKIAIKATFHNIGGA